MCLLAASKGEKIAEVPPASGGPDKEKKSAEKS